MTDNQIEKRYKILVNLLGKKRDDYSIQLDNIFISIRNKNTLEGIYTDSLRIAKRWIRSDQYNV